MRFDLQKGSPPYLNRRDQWRLLAMLTVLLLIVMAIEVASQPSSWYWLTGQPPETAVATVQARLTNGKVAEGDDVKLDAALFAAVRDDSLGIKNKERAAYFHILATARDTPQSSLKQTALQDVTFAQLSADPDDYRGRLISIVGQVRRLHAFPAVANERGVETLYEAWLFTADSGLYPLVVHCTEIPDDIPQGDAIDLRCRLTGYFFKMYAYAASSGPRSAPMLLGKRLHWFSPPTSPLPPASTEFGLAAYVLGWIVLIGSAVAIVMWRFSVGDKRFRQAHMQRIMKRPPADIDGIHDLDTIELSDFLTGLSKNADETQPRQNP